ncbi:MAG: OmpA family protein [Bacteroidota bacterium]|nr:OmpA family protein [Bacteroidota bacterium]
MMKKIKIIFCFFILVTLCSFSSLNKFLRNAEKETEKGNIKEAKVWYLKALEKDPENYNANLGFGILLSEVIEDYTGALPYLNKALSKSQANPVGDLLFALGKSYQNEGDYEKAISFFEKLKNYEDYEEEEALDFQKDIQKRIEDCKYAVAHKTVPESKDWYIVNAGKSINSDMPEYVPVLTLQNELIFTSRRKDDKREGVSYLDGKYFESMYIASIANTGFKDMRRYTLPDQFLKSRFLKHHESIVSMSPDGKKLFVYRENKIYEIKTEERKSKKPKRLLKTINFDFYQNHAFLTKDGNTLYFTSEAKGGIGGIDIYKSTKIKEGEWSKPENVGEPINTPFDEDAPFVTEDGKTMYFASKGHEGYGNYDIYKSTNVDCKWTKPENLGQPINSSAHDIFMVQDGGGSVGYFSSARPGGHGDMDIYKINYLSNINKECPTLKDEKIVATIVDDNLLDFKNKIVLKTPNNYKTLQYEWKVNGANQVGLPNDFTYDYSQAGTYTVTSKTIYYCDTCLSPIISCNTIENKFETTKVDSSIANVVLSTVDLTKVKGELNSEQLIALGFNVNPMLFDFDKSIVRNDAEEILKANIAVLKKFPSLSVEIIGYTDTRGTEVYNKELSKQRANSIKKYLINSGIKTSQINLISGKSTQNPSANCIDNKNCDDTVHQKNRRAVFKVFSN